MEEIANQPLQTDFSPVAMVEADVDAMSCEIRKQVEFTEPRLRLNLTSKKDSKTHLSSRGLSTDNPEMMTKQ